MVIHVKDEEADALVRKLAQKRGISITTAIKEAVRESLHDDSRKAVQQDDRPLEKRLEPLLSRLDRLPRASLRTDKAFFDDLWGEGDG